jgi:hypothetical protein
MEGLTDALVVGGRLGTGGLPFLGFIDRLLENG